MKGNHHDLQIKNDWNLIKLWRQQHCEAAYSAIYYNKMETHLTDHKNIPTFTFLQMYK